MAAVEVLVDGLRFGEDPRWHDGRLWFSDFYDHRVATVGSDGEVETVVEVPGQPSGLGWLPDGRLLVVSMRDLRVLRLEPDGELVEHADLSGVATFLANDMVVDRHGRAYVGNFGFDLHRDLVERDVGDVLTDHPTATLAIVEPDGSVRPGPDGLHFPNGMVITPDGSTMVLAETLALRLTAFTIDADGSLGDRREWAALELRTPDGICLDAEGAVWFANATAGECVRVAEGGEVLDVVATDMPVFACALGGDDGRTLHLVSAPDSHPDVVAEARRGRILTTRVDVPGATGASA